MVACLREVEEETGIVLHPNQVRLVIPEFTFCIPETRVELRKPVYLAFVEDTVVHISAEHLDAAWWTEEEVPPRLGWDSYRQTFLAVAAAIR